ncbi:MAG: hypothetical protein A2Z99_03490 [Treponema sp. GWB1_62_6]|nr:MAG: hypothetical protein A2Z99_03490 [Treponema sp. GWB1_62_6]OHE67395.1 MAG: hypothetical protein A2001_07245 [Treponema sp. GWC1_61_84]OHE74715.1 MAG: hypothetical protein A2413_13100 [Treponema sp. RIFOXYC1_FULL_61_9]
METVNKPLVIAHRGYRAIAPENTLLAAQKGFEAGAEWWELDTAETKDGELVVIHDDNLVRTTDAKKTFPGRSPWIVYDFTLEELRKLDAGSWFAAADPFRQIAAGVVRRTDVFHALKVPTLRECLVLTRDLGMKVNVEIKSAAGHACDASIVEKTVALIRELDMREDVLISSFNHPYLARVKAADAGIRTGILIDDPLADPVEKLKDLGAFSLNPNVAKLDEATVRRVREAGFEVYPWTVNDESDMRRLLEWGVSGLITDFVDRARGSADAYMRGQTIL